MFRRHLLLPLVATVTLSACGGSSSTTTPGAEAVPVGGGMAAGSVVPPTAPSTATYAPEWAPNSGNTDGTGATATPTTAPGASTGTRVPVTVPPLPDGQIGAPVDDQDAIDAWETLLNDALSSDATTLEFDARMALLDDADDTVNALSDLAARTDLPRVRFVVSGARTLTADQCPVDGVDECVAVDAQLVGSGGDVVSEQANTLVVKRGNTWFVARPTVCWMLLLTGTTCSR